MTPEAFHARLQRLGLTAGAFARLTGISRSTVSGWGRTRHQRDVQPFPDWIPLLLDAWDQAPQALHDARSASAPN